MENISLKFKRKHARYLRYAVAACLITLSAIGVFLWNSQNQALNFEMEFNPSALLKHENSSHDTSDFALEDGSTIKLYPNSTLFYPEHFDGDHRKVLLSGEAFFEVTKDTARPFLVVNHHNIIHVMGTSFLVRSFSKIEKTEINVMSGTVWVKEMKSVVSTLKSLRRSRASS